MPSIQPFDPFLDKKAAKASPTKLLKGADENKPSTSFQQSFQGHFQGHLDPKENPPNRLKKAGVGEEFKPLSRKAPDKDRGPSRLERSPLEKNKLDKNQLDKKPKFGAEKPNTEKLNAEKTAQSRDRRLENQDQKALEAKAGQNAPTSEIAEGPSNSNNAKSVRPWDQSPGEAPPNQDPALTAAGTDAKAGVVFLSPFFFPNLAENSASLTVLEGSAEGSSAARQSLFAGKNGEFATGRWSADSLSPNFAWQTDKKGNAADSLTNLPSDQAAKDASKSLNGPQAIDAKTQDLLKAHAAAFDQGAQAKILASNPALSEKTLAEKLNKLEQQGEAKAEKVNLGNREFEMKASIQKQGSEKGFESFDGNFKQASSSNRKQPGLDAFAKGFTAESFKLYSEQNQPSAPVLSPTNMKAFEENLSSLRTTGRENFVLDLKPEGLGRMDFRFIRNGKELRAEIAVQDLELAENLKKDIKHLRTSLEKHGFVVDDLKILVKAPQNSLNFGAPFAQQNPNSDFLGGFQQQQSGAFTKKQANPPLAQARVQDEVRVERASRVKDPSQLIDVEA